MVHSWESGLQIIIYGWEFRPLLFFSSKMYNSTGKARYPHSRAELSFVF